MLKKLKYILNSYNDDEIDTLDLWVNSDELVKQIVIDNYSLDLITESFKIETKLKKDD